MDFKKLVENESKNLDESLEEASKFKMGLIGAGVSATLYNAALGALVAATGGAAALIGPLVIPGLIIGVGFNTFAFRQFAKGAQRTIGGNLIKHIDKRDILFRKLLKTIESGDAKPQEYKSILRSLDGLNKRIERLGEKLKKALDSGDDAGLFRRNIKPKDRVEFEGLIDDIAMGKTVSFLPERELKKINAFVIELKKQYK